jgi:hypothetical protein
MGWEFRVVKREWNHKYFHEVRDCYAIHEVYIDDEINKIVKVEKEPYNLLETDYDTLRDHISKINQCLDKQIIDDTGKEI